MILTLTAIRSSGLPEFLRPLVVDEKTVTYRPPSDVCAEFEVDMITICVGDSYNLPPVNCGCILLMSHGCTANISVAEVDDSIDASGRSSTLAVGLGSVLFIPAGASASIRCDPADDIDSCVFYRAHVNLG